MLLKVAVDSTQWFQSQAVSDISTYFSVSQGSYGILIFVAAVGIGFFSSYTVLQQNASPEKGAEITGTNIFQDFNHCMEIQLSSDELRPDGRGKNRAVFLKIALL